MHRPFQRRNPGAGRLIHPAHVILSSPYQPAFLLSSCIPPPVILSEAKDLKIKWAGARTSRSHFNGNKNPESHCRTFGVRGGQLLFVILVFDGVLESVQAPLTKRFMKRMIFLGRRGRIGALCNRGEPKKGISGKIGWTEIMNDILRPPRLWCPSRSQKNARLAGRPPAAAALIATVFSSFCLSG